MKVSQYKVCKQIKWKHMKPYTYIADMWKGWEKHTLNFCIKLSLFNDTYYYLGQLKKECETNDMIEDKMENSNNFISPKEFLKKRDSRV